jgi:hypothetical protein
VVDIPIAYHSQPRLQTSIGFGIKRKMSGYKLRPRTPQPTVRIDFTAAIRIVK